MEITWLSINMDGEDDANDHANGCHHGQSNHVANHLTTLDAVGHHLIPDLMKLQKILWFNNIDTQWEIRLPFSKLVSFGVTRLGDFSPIGILLEALYDFLKAQNNGDFWGYFLFKQIYYIFF